MHRKSWLWGVVGAIAVAGLCSAPRFASADGTTPPAPPTPPAPACGTSDNPCPLQKWMRANMGAALSAGDMDALGKAFDRAATFAPDASWTTWGQFAKQGSTAAAAKDAAGVKAACKACHDAHKDNYKTKFRGRAVN
jgi:hypothetical protein